MIHVECPHCSKKLSAPEKYAGRQVNCKSCNGIFMLPDMSAIAEQQANADSASSGGSDPAGQSSAQQPLPPQSAGMGPASSSPATPLQGQQPAPVRPSLATPMPGNSAPPAMAMPAGQPQPGMMQGQAVQQPITQPAHGSGMPAPGYVPGPAMAGVPGGSLDDISYAEAQHQRTKLGVDAMSLIEARNWTALFDIRFRKFLAPKILRLLWIIFLIGIILWFCFATFIMIVGVFASISAATEGPAAPVEGLEPAVLLTNVGAITPEPAQMGQFPDNDPFGGGFESPASSVSAAGGLLGFTITMVTYCLTVLGMFIVLCWARVVFETLHVFYNVAGTLKAIEQKL